jgi:hypothetical protein
MWWAGHVAHMGERRNVYSVLVGKFKEKCPLERPKCRWKYWIKWTFGSLFGVEWIHLAQNRDRWWAVVQAVMKHKFVAPWSYLIRKQRNITQIKHIPTNCIHIAFEGDARMATAWGQHRRNKGPHVGFWIIHLCRVQKIPPIFAASYIDFTCKNQLGI